MRYRALDANGDMTFGQGSANFLIDSVQCVEQAIVTGLRLLQGEWFYDATAGMPWEQKVVGFTTQSEYDQAIQTQVRSTQGVTGITGYSSSLNRETRVLTVNIAGQTPYGAFSVTVPLPLGGFGVGGFDTRGFGQ